MNEVYPLMLGLLLGILAMLGLARLSKKDQPAQDVRPFDPPTPTTTPTPITELDDDITPPGTSIADHVDWADDGR